MTSEKKTVLVVDDQADLVDLIQTILTRRGYNVVTASNGEQAFQMVKRMTPDLVILDLMMPLMGGLTFYQCISSGEEDRPRFPVLMVTGNAQELAEHQEFKFDGILKKPFEIDDLVEAVDRLIEKKI